MKQTALRRVVPTLFWATAFLTCLELLLEFRAYQRGFDTLVLGTKASSTLDGTESAVAAETYGPTRDFPFRSRISAQGTRSICIASASYAEDLRVPVDRIFPTILETTLREDRTDLIVINASRAGQTIDDNVQTLEGSMLNVYSPKVVVLYQMGNDLKRLTSPSPDTRTLETWDLPVLPPIASELRAMLHRTTAYSHLRMEVAARGSLS
jgi:hypothetical protein